MKQIKILLIAIIFILLAAVSYAISFDEGCCERFCELTTQEQCYDAADPFVNDNFLLGTSCRSANCNIGCCVDFEGYCLSNYLKSNCEKYGYSFIKKECTELTNCVQPPQSNSVRQHTGINTINDIIMLPYYEFLVEGATVEDNNVVWDPNEQFGSRTTMIRPLSGRAGSNFIVNYIIDYPADITNVKAIFRTDIEIDSIELFDNGFNEDGAANDGIYGATWTSPSMPAGFNKITVDFEITRAGTIFSHENAVDITVVSGSDCMPIFTWMPPEENNDIIFLGNGYSMANSEERIIQDANNNVQNLMVISPFVYNLENLNYYVITQNQNLNLGSDINNIILSDCSFFNPSQDVAIIMDYREGHCRQISDRIFITSPETVYYYDNNLDLDQALSNMCGVFTTFGDYIWHSIQPPQIEWITEEDKTFWQQIQKIEYRITDITDPIIYYEVFLNDATRPLFTDNALNGDIEEMIFQFPTGRYKLSIEATNARDNKAYSLPPFEFSVDTRYNYEAYIITPSDGGVIEYTNPLNKKFNITFYITHNAAEHVIYELYIDDELKASDVINVSQMINVTIDDLQEGGYTLTIKATDLAGRQIESNEIIFYVKDPY